MIFFFSLLLSIFKSMFRRAFGQAAKMSTYTTDKASPFTRAVITSMRKLYVDQTRSLFFFSLPHLLRASDRLTPMVSFYLQISRGIGGSELR